MRKIDKFFIICVMQLCCFVGSGFADTLKPKVVSIKGYKDAIDSYKNVKKNSQSLMVVGNREDRDYVYNTVLLDTSSLDKIRHFSFPNKTIRVESGVTLRAIQDFVNKYGLSIPAFDLSIDQTVNDLIGLLPLTLNPNVSSMTQCIKSITYLAPDGRIKKVTAARDHEFFSLIIGGHHLFGAILEAEIRLEKNSIYKKRSQVVHYKQYINHLKKTVVGNQAIEFHQGYFNLESGDNFLGTLQANSYIASSNLDSDVVVQKLHHQNVDIPYIRLSENDLPQKEVTDSKIPFDAINVARNGLLRSPELQALKRQGDREIYIVPLENFTWFVDDLRRILLNHQAPLKAITTAYIPEGDKRYLLSGLPSSIAIHIYGANSDKENNKNADKQSWKKALNDLAVKYGAKTTLENAASFSKQHLVEISQKYKLFFELKRKHDPENVFTNVFYLKTHDHG